MGKQQRNRREQEFTMNTIAKMVKDFGKPSLCMGALAQVVATYLAVWDTTPEENREVLEDFLEDILERMSETNKSN